MLSQFYGNEIIKELTKSSSTVVELQAGSILKLGGYGSQLKTNLSLSTAVVGIGGMESPITAHTIYYVYVVISGVTEYLIATTSEIKPLAFNAYRKVGAFLSSDVPDIFYAYNFNGAIDFEHVPVLLEIIDNNATSVKSVSPNTDKAGFSRRGDKVLFDFQYYQNPTPGIAGVGTYRIPLPMGLQTEIILNSVGAGNSPTPRGTMSSDIGGGTFRDFTLFPSGLTHINAKFINGNQRWGAGFSSMNSNFLAVTGKIELPISEWQNQELNWNQY